MYALLGRAADSVHALAKRAGVNESVITGLNPVEYDSTNVSPPPSEHPLTPAHYCLHHSDRHHPSLHPRVGIRLFIRQTT